MYLLMLLDGSGEYHFLSKIGFGGIIVYFWFITVNTWFFYRMRCKKEVQKIKQRTRWMLKVKVWVFAGSFLSCLFALFPFGLLHDAHDQLTLAICMAPVVSFVFTRIWSNVATASRINQAGDQIGSDNRET